MLSSFNVKRLEDLAWTKWHLSHHGLTVKSPGTYESGLVKKEETVVLHARFGFQRSDRFSTPVPVSVNASTRSTILWTRVKSEFSERIPELPVDLSFCTSSINPHHAMATDEFIEVVDYWTLKITKWGDNRSFPYPGLDFYSLGNLDKNKTVRFPLQIVRT